MGREPSCAGDHRSGGHGGRPCGCAADRDGPENRHGHSHAVDDHGTVALPRAEAPPGPEASAQRPIQPLLPPERGPDPGDLAMFSSTARLPGVSAAPPEHAGPPADAGPTGTGAPPEPGGHDLEQAVVLERPRRGKHRRRARSTLLAGGAVAVAVGATAVAVSLLGGRTGEGDARLDADPGPSIALPDGDTVSGDEDDTEDEADEQAPAPDDDGVADDAALPESGAPEPPGRPGPDEERERAGVPDRSAPPRESGGPRASDTAPSDDTAPPAPPESETPQEDRTTPPETVLGPGDEGPEVRALQERLNELGDHFRVEVTGVYDQATFDSVARFQEWYGVWEREERGVYCTVTQERLATAGTSPSG
ncbi:peptidoglycan-binding protein [Streptomyces sp. SM14]|uniref:peptidoglycan-binding protein n=1 Tax=Streptomyces sp. SM14 TaxID=1736045 RepID=UPI000CD56ED1|nr:peptidoglycan-binding protein [Streptomyces sp. SM14]